jgi:hypothetical protein
LGEGAAAAKVARVATRTAVNFMLMMERMKMIFGIFER